MGQGFPYCGWLRNPASPKRMLETQRKFHRMVVTTRFQVVISLPSTVSLVLKMQAWLGFNIYPLVNIQKAIANGHRNSRFSHQKWWIFPYSFL
jgi:hypothetical protein